MGNQRKALKDKVLKKQNFSETNKNYLFVKRFFDAFFSLAALIILSPIFLLIALMIKLNSKGPVFYKHKRIGKDGKTIWLYKFRSMYDGADKELKKLLKNPKRRKEWKANFKLDNDPRITKVGKILRICSLDELPQLINVLKGDMSLVGPRPIVKEELKKYGKNQKKLLSILPGLTGWWACNGRSCRNYEDRIALELYYVDHMSIWLDIKIIFKTVIAVLRGHGAK